MNANLSPRRSMLEDEAWDWTASSFRRVRAGYLCVALLALAVYLPAVWWGVPHATAPNRTHAWGVDDETPLGTLAEMYGIRRDVEHRNLGYPLLYAFMTSAAGAPYIAGARMTGAFTQPSPEYPYGFADPVRAIAILGTIAHLVTALMAVAIVLAAWDIGRIALGARAAPFTAAAALLAYPMVYYARTGNVDVPMLCFIALAFAAFVRCVVLGTTTRRSIALGVAVGLALATKEAALGAFIGMAIVMLVHRAHETREEGGLFTWAGLRPLVIALAVAVTALAIGSGFAIDPGRYIAHLRFLTGRLDSLTAGENTAVETFAYTLDGNLAFARALIADLAAIMTWPGLIAAAGGIVLLAFRRRGLALLVPAFAYILWMFATLRAAQLRYMLPGALLLIPAEAAMLVALIRSDRRALRLAGGITSLFIIGTLGLRSFEITDAMIHDTRYDAGRWIAEHIQRGETIEYFGADQKLPPIPAGVTSETAAPYRGMYSPDDVSDEAVERIIAGWERRAPRFVLAIPDHTNPGAPHSRSFPPTLFEMLDDGQGPYVLVATFQHRRRFPWLPMPPLDYPVIAPPIRIFERR